MSGYDDFEVRLEHALRRYGDQASMPFDPAVIAERAIGARRAPPAWRMLLVPALVLGLLIATAIAIATLRPPDPAPTPPSSGELQQPAGDMHSATLLEDGRILVLDGIWTAVRSGLAETAEVWDPRTGTSTRLTTERVDHRIGAPAVRLQDGRVLIAGGYGGEVAYASSALASTEIWDPTTEQFEPGEPMLHQRVGHTLTPLHDGRVLVIGGDGIGGVRAEAEVFDPQTGHFTAAGELHTARSGHTATLLQDGSVMVAGGLVPNDAGARPLASVEVWDPATGGFREAGSLRTARVGHTATGLTDGRVLLVGGYVGLGYGLLDVDFDRQRVRFPPPGFVDGFLASTEVWDPASGMSEETGSLGAARTAHAASLLPDGRVAVIGGITPMEEDGEMYLVTLATVEVWDPATGSFSGGAPLEAPRAHHSVIPTRSGHLIVMGGQLGLERLASVEVWTPD